MNNKDNPINPDDLIQIVAVKRDIVSVEPGLQITKTDYLKAEAENTGVQASRSVILTLGDETGGTYAYCIPIKQVRAFIPDLLMCCSLAGCTGSEAILEEFFDARKGIDYSDTGSLPDSDPSDPD